MHIARGSCHELLCCADLSQAFHEETDGVQVVTAGVLIRALYKPLSRRSLLPKWQPDVAWRMPTLQGALNFVAYAGPICGVLITKVIVYGMHHPLVTLDMHHCLRTTVSGVMHQ